MHLSLDVLAAVIEGSPGGLAACRAIGMTPAQVAYAAISDLADAPPGARDQMLSVFAEQHGIYGVRNERDFAAFLDDAGRRATGEVQRINGRPFEAKLDRDAHARHAAAQSRNTPTTWTASGIKHVAGKVAGAGLSQGLNAKLAKGDGPASGGVAPRWRDDHESDQLMHARIAQGLGDGSPSRTRYQGMTYETASVGDHVRAAFEHHEAEANRADAERDQVEDHRAWSNTIYTD